MLSVLGSGRMVRGQRAARRAKTADQPEGIKVVVILAVGTGHAGGPSGTAPSDTRANKNPILDGL